MILGSSMAAMILICPLHFGQLASAGAGPGAPPSCSGSIIGLMDCSLGEELSLPGVPTKLRYSTLTKPGRLSEKTITVLLYADNFPAGS
jgi:hypothetical protein